MFGLPSLTKLLVLVAVILLVWYGFKLVKRLDAARGAPSKGRPSSIRRLDMVECKRCGTFIPAGSRAQCNDDHCPLA